MPPIVRELSHTADVGFEVRASTLEGLFRGAARGLVDALGLEAAGEAGETDSVRLARPDLERLLVHWLRELLAEATVRGEVPETDVTEVRGGGDGDDGATLRAAVSWLPAAPGGPVREIKGVTYHGLRVAREEGGWHARVVVDV